MSENKTQPTSQSPEEFLATLEPARRREEGRALLELMRDVTGDAGTMWGPSIIGFGSRHYTYATGREGDWMRVGFSPRKGRHSLYGLKDFPTQQQHITALGTYTEGAGCVYVKKLADVDTEVLRALVELGYAEGDYDARQH